MSYSRWSEDCGIYAYPCEEYGKNGTFLKVNDEILPVRDVKILLKVCQQFLEEYGDEE